MLPKEMHIKDRSRMSNQGNLARTIAYDEYHMPRACERCGKQGNVEVHHINRDRDDNRRENLKILCRYHHNAEHHVINQKTLPEPIELWKHYRCDGATLSSVGAIFGISSSTVSRILEDAGYSRRKQGSYRQRKQISPDSQKGG